LTKDELKSSSDSDDKQEKIRQYLNKKKGNISHPSIKTQGSHDNRLSFGQQRLWFLYKLDPLSPVYNRPTVLQLRGNLNEKALEKSVNLILNRHEILRTIFPNTDGIPSQKIIPFAEISLPTADFSNQTISNKFDYLQERVSEIGNEPFLLEQGPITRFQLLKIDNSEYFFIFVTHHILFDAWSETIFIDELISAYVSLSKGIPPSLPDLHIQYSDFSSWQIKRFEEGVYKKDLDFWRNHLQGLSNLELPLDYPRKQTLTYHGNSKIFILHPEVRNQLVRLCKQYQVTLSTLLLSIYLILLYQYTGQPEIVIGIPVSGRKHPASETLIGMFINTLVIRESLSGNVAFLDFLSRVKTTTLEAITHQDAPFEHLINELQPERNQGRHPLFQVLYNYVNVPQPVSKSSDLEISNMDIHLNVSHYELSLTVLDSDDYISCRFEFNTDLFHPMTIDRFILHYQTIIDSIISEPEIKIKDISLLSKFERKLILEDWNNTDFSFPPSSSINQLIEKQVVENPNQIAVISPANLPNTNKDRFLTYNELNNKANQLAHYLRKMGIGPDDPVGISVDRSIEMIVSILGILKAGGAYVPLDPAYPVERLSMMIKDVQLDVLITQQNLVGNYDTQDLSIICFDSDWDRISLESVKNPRHLTNPENLAYIIYSSGSTGAPKGIMIEHKALLNYSLYKLSRFKIKENDGSLQFSSINFDFSIAEIFPCFICGARLILRTEEVVESISELFELIRKFNVTHINLTTPFWHQVSKYVEAPEVKFPKCLQYITVGGDKLIHEDVWPWQNKFESNPILVNDYGPTETTVSSTVYEIPKDRKFIKPPPIGRPIYNEKAFILDSYLNPVPIGVTGEIYISGEGVARGYVNRPTATAENFIPNHISSKTGKRLYKTGDLGRYLPDGNIEFIGRIDHQVKIRGYRIELGEIESTLNIHPDVQKAIVIAWDHKSGYKYLIGYIQPVNGKIPIEDDLRLFLLSKLPEYMIPRYFLFLDSFPLTPSGKMDRLGFPKPDNIRPEQGTKYRKPRTVLEKYLLEIWLDILDLDSIGIDDDFFSLGGHSLLVTRIITRIKNEIKIGISIRNLFDFPTISGLAKMVEDQIRDSYDSLLANNPDSKLKSIMESTRKK